MKVLGTNYKVKIVKKQTEIMKALDCIGYCDFEKKEIYVLDNKDKDDTLVHELVHAHLNESFHEEQSYDEELVNTITKIVLSISKLIK